MKSNVVKSLMLVVVIFSSIIVSAGNRSNMFHGTSYSEKGNYTLEKLGTNINFNGTSLETWMITYSLDAAPILIGVKNLNEKRIFHVKASNMEVDYVADALGFGVRLPERGWTTTDPAVVSSSINPTAFNQQIKLTSQKHNNEYLMQLIACYLPDLNH